jgi:N-acetylmuramoyl-L-alanine amidase
MSLNIRDFPSSNFSSEIIPVEFLVLHYTACTLQEALRLFTTPERKVCAHFVIDLDGSIYDLGGFIDGPLRRGAHAGISAFELEGRKWEDFNRFSIGVELVNFNGNIFPYPTTQYDSLVELTRHLQSRFPALKNPNRVVGHEQIAGFRGKVDPGTCFDWKLFFTRAFSVGLHPSRIAIFDTHLRERFERIHGKINPSVLTEAEWPELSSRIEAFVGQR